MNNDQRKIIGYDPNTGQPVYEQINIQNNTIQNVNSAPMKTQTLINNNMVQNQEYKQMSNNQQQVVNQNMNQQPVGQQQMINPNYQTNNMNGQAINGGKKKSNNKKILLFSIIGIVILGIIVGAVLIFGGKKNYTRTVMIYMVGSNLESDSRMATVELDELEYFLTDKKNVKVVLIAGGSKTWYNDYIDKDETSIYELTVDGFEKVKIQSIQNMADSKVFSDFLNYVYDNYKSDKYDLVFWNHGGAIMGSEQDELYNNDILQLTEMREGLANSPFNSKNKLETVIFSTCLNGTIEVADVFSDYSEYLVASEEATLSVGFTGDLKFIHDIESDDSGYDVSLKFLNVYKDKIAERHEYYEYITGEKDPTYSTYSIINLKNVKKLINSVNDFFSDIDVNKNFNTIARVRANVYQYPTEDLSYDMVDLYNLVDGLKELSPGKANKVLDNLNNAVVYNWATNSNSRGLSIYFPYNADSRIIDIFLKLYDDFDKFDQYRAFIKNFNNIQKSSIASKSYAKNSIKVDSNEEEADFILELDDDQIETFATAKYMVFRDNKDGTYKPIYVGGKATLAGNTLKATIKDRQLSVVSKVDSSEYPLILKEIDNGSDYIKYQTDVILQDFRPESISDWKMDRARISLIYDKSTNKIEISNIVLIEESNLPNKISLDLKDYQSIAFSLSGSYSILDENGNYTGNIVSNGTVEGYEEKVDKFEFKLKNFDDDYDYYCVFAIKDTHNNVSYSKLVKMN